MRAALAASVLWPAAAAAAAVPAAYCSAAAAIRQFTN